MAGHENAISINLARGATLREVPKFMLEGWGSTIRKFSKNSDNLATGISTIRTMHMENKLDINDIDIQNLIPKDSIAFFHGNQEAMTYMFSPKMDQVIISQTIKTGRKNSEVKKSMLIKTNEHGFIEEVIFDESFKAPNSDTAMRSVRVNYGLGGQVENITQGMSIKSKMDYLASGLTPLEYSRNLHDGRERESVIQYSWSKKDVGPYIV